MADAKPLWLLIEEKILEAAPADLEGAAAESTIHKIAAALDETGQNVSLSGRSLLELRWAVDERQRVGHPLLKDVNDAIAALTLDDVADTYVAAMKLINSIGESFPALKEADRRDEVLRMIADTKLNLLIKKAKEQEGDKGIRLLIEEEVAGETIISAMGITEEKLAQVNADIAAERAEIARVKELLEGVADKSDEDKIRHLMEKSVAEALIIELAGVDQQAVDSAKASIAKELEEKKKKEEEEAARKKAEAEGPSLDNIPDDEMLEHIEAVREILDLVDKEDEIKTMCEQSQIPKCLIEIALSDVDKLDELEEKAGG